MQPQTQRSSEEPGKGEPQIDNVEYVNETNSVTKADSGVTPAADDVVETNEVIIKKKKDPIVEYIESTKDSLNDGAANTAESATNNLDSDENKNSQDGHRKEDEACKIEELTDKSEAESTSENLKETLDEIPPKPARAISDGKSSIIDDPKEENEDKSAKKKKTKKKNKKRVDSHVDEKTNVGDEPKIISALETESVAGDTEVIDAQKYFSSRKTAESPKLPPKNK